VFVLATDQWPLRTVVLRPDGAGDMQPYTCFYATLDHEQDAQICRHCDVRMLAGPIFRDIAGTSVWHTECWLLELRLHVKPQSVERWVLCTIEWANAL